MWCFDCQYTWQEIHRPERMFWKQNKKESQVDWLKILRKIQVSRCYFNLPFLKPTRQLKAFFAFIGTLSWWKNGSRSMGTSPCHDPMPIFGSFSYHKQPSGSYWVWIQFYFGQNVYLFWKFRFHNPYGF